MQKYNSLKNVFFLRTKDEWAKCYNRVDFWVTIFAGVLLALSFVLARYVDGSGTGTSYAQIAHHTKNWSVILCGIITVLCGLYMIVINLTFRNSSVLSGVNIGLGLLIAISFLIEYVVLKKIGFISDGTTVTMANKAGIGYYLGVLGGFIFACLEFYKLGAQGYYTAEEIAKEKENQGVSVVDGVVIIDGEPVNNNATIQGDNIIVQNAQTDNSLQNSTVLMSETDNSSTNSATSKTKTSKTAKEDKTTKAEKTAKVEKTARADKTAKTSKSTKTKIETILSEAKAEKTTKAEKTAEAKAEKMTKEDKSAKASVKKVSDKK